MSHFTFTINCIDLDSDLDSDLSDSTFDIDIDNNDSCYSDTETDESVDNEKYEDISDE